LTRVWLRISRTVVEGLIKSTDGVFDSAGLIFILSLPGTWQRNSMMICYRVRMLGKVRHANKTYSQRASFYVIKCVVAYLGADVSAAPPVAVLCRPGMNEIRTNFYTRPHH